MLAPLLALRAETLKTFSKSKTNQAYIFCFLSFFFFLLSIENVFAESSDLILTLTCHCNSMHPETAGKKTRNF